MYYVELEKILERTTKGSELLASLKQKVEDYIKSGLADSIFENGFYNSGKGSFYQRLWEVNLYHYFIEQGFSPTSTSKGPDFGIDFENKTIWIEAISPEPRNIPIDFLEPPEDEFEVQSLPEEEILLRITSSVKEKAKKFKEYLKKGVISKDDICVIAIDITQLGFWSHLTTNNFPPFLNAVYPIGHIQITINKKNKKVIKSDYEYRDSIQNKNQSDVPTNTFLNDYFLPIGAILGARTNNLITLNNITVIHNFLARSRFPSNFFRVEHEYYPEQKEDKIILSDLAENN